MSNCSFEVARYDFFKLRSFIVNEMFTKDGGRRSPPPEAHIVALCVRQSYFRNPFLYFLGHQWFYFVRT